MPTENISKFEKIISMSIGVRLLLHGIDHLKSKPFGSTLKIALGIFLLNRGNTGYCPANDFLGLNTAGKTIDDAIEIYTSPNI